MGGRANPLRAAAAIVAIGQTGFAKRIDRPEGQLAAEAVVAALRAASIAPTDVDGVSSFSMESFSMESFSMESAGRVTPARTIGAGDITAEGVRQLRGTSTSPVAGARPCLVTSGEGVPASALVLRAA